MRREGGLTRGRTPLQTASLLVGIVFLAVGILGFIPGITTNYGDVWSNFIGEGSDAKLLGLSQVNGFLNIVHLLFGVVGSLAAASRENSRLFLIGGGAVYLVIWLYGIVIDLDSRANFVSINTADNWLHFLLGAGMIAAGVVLSRGVGRERPAAASRV